MKNNLNVIQIKGLKGLMVACIVVCCLFSGFVISPGWALMQLWNHIALKCTALYSMPVYYIGLFQGVWLWAMIVVAYFTFRKDRLILCLRNPQALSDEELRTVFRDIKKQAEEDPVLRAMLKARESEFKLQAEKFEKDKKEKEEAEALVNTEHREG